MHRSEREASPQPAPHGELPAAAAPHGELPAAAAPSDIFEAAAGGVASRVTELLDRDAGLVRAISVDGYTPLHIAAYHGHGDVVRRLLRRGADPMAIARNELRSQPLHSAVAGGSCAIVEQLLQAGAAADARQAGGTTALHMAAAKGDSALVRLLRGRGAR